MHILLLPPTYPTAEAPWRGAAFRDQARALVQAGQWAGVAYVEPRFRTLCFRTTVIDDDGVQTMRMKGRRSGSASWLRRTCALAAEYVSRFGAPDVVHGFGSARDAASVVAHALGRPYVVSEHVPQIVDCDYFHPPQFTRRDPFTVLTISDLDRRTRLDAVIAAFARLRERMRDAQLVIAGGGRDEHRLRRAAELSGASDGIRFTGALPRWSVRCELWDASAVVLPGGTAAIEALACCVPSIVVRGSAAEDVIRDDGGMTIASDGEETLLAAMREMAARRFDRARLRASARSRFGYPAVARQLCAVYDRVLHSNQEVA